MKSSKARMEELEALEARDAAQRPDLPTYICFHADDWEAYIDLVTPVETKAAIADAYQLGSSAQKLYIGLCMCDPPESCRVCDDRPFLTEA